jgi:hypothetical protein
VLNRFFQIFVTKAKRDKKYFLKWKSEKFVFLDLFSPKKNIFLEGKKDKMYFSDDLNNDDYEIAVKVRTILISSRKTDLSQSTLVK